MEIKQHTHGKITIAELVSSEVIRSPEDANDLLAQAQADYIVIHEHNVDPSFFDLSSRIAGEMLQKLSNYHVKLAIIGNFEKYQSKILKYFMYESNKTGDVLFMSSMKEVLERWK